MKKRLKAKIGGKTTDQHLRVFHPHGYRSLRKSQRARLVAEHTPAVDEFIRQFQQWRERRDAR